MEESIQITKQQKLLSVREYIKLHVVMVVICCYLEREYGKDFKFLENDWLPLK